MWCGLSWTVFLYYVRYLVISNGATIINLYDFFFLFLMYVIFMNCIQVFPSLCGKYHVHNIFDTAYRTAMIYDMLDVTWITGETSRQFQTRFKEYAIACKNNYSKGAYTQHLINHGHLLGHTEDNMEVIFTTHIGKYLDTVEKYPYIRKRKKGLQIFFYGDKSIRLQVSYFQPF
jgi:hypothetical protein